MALLYQLALDPKSYAPVWNIQVFQNVVMITTWKMSLGSQLWVTICRCPWALWPFYVAHILYFWSAGCFTSNIDMILWDTNIQSKASPELLWRRHSPWPTASTRADASSPRPLPCASPPQPPAGRPGRWQAGGWIQSLMPPTTTVLVHWSDGQSTCMEIVIVLFILC